MLYGVQWEKWQHQVMKVTYCVRNLTSFHLIQAKKIQRVSRIQAVLCMKVNRMKKCLIFPHGMARPQFAFVGVSGVNVDLGDETSVLDCFQKFIDEDMWQLFAEQTNIYANQFLAGKS
jgi:hypothetical protein